MTSKSTSKKPVGVIGAGSFGSAIANILAEKSEVLLYARDSNTVKKIAENKENRGHKLHTNVTPTGDLSYLANSCDVIFPIVPSSAFRSMMQQLSPYLHPYHILIHGTKGLDISLPPGETIDSAPFLTRENIRTMSEVIMDESVVIRVGCLAGPNLAKEMAANHPAATVVASHYKEVIREGEKLLRNDRFQVYGNSDLIGIELAGVLKNIIAIASGALSGLGLGENAKGLLISRGMVEMIHLGKAMGGDVEAFVGLAGIGDLVTTCNSTLSRNFTVGHRLAKGETLDEILADMEEVAEGVNTVRIAKKFIDTAKLRAPITEALHEVLFEGLTVDKALQLLMRYPYNVDIDFL
ncbi:NAD(P)H-dependent glycerol-3-phosphate dehydrogenase [Fulvivirga kasyanovii]|uniref:Glycerol-3-phosphate dehydrogenase [NAD(P)+] n=1 Tax=Fulvivirga kasyanovii TaxID=396812 RepID=A0ABW9RKJ2_9BACT|nr:NAD(P)H-dependent glycerol-3-phosphate dehydrogenase [Fulvivirga kasyanovii]MTI23884.1 NAD(P)-dependent glycerol-3-phosphate dehydrogenase [Fulvivirga kasyanovii]